MASDTKKLPLFSLFENGVAALVVDRLGIHPTGRSIGEAVQKHQVDHERAMLEIEQCATVSIAISLKRIADALEHVEITDEPAPGAPWIPHVAGRSRLPPTSDAVGKMVRVRYGTHGPVEEGIAENFDWSNNGRGLITAWQLVF